jgi:type I restriction-modification system DNA methylase subunit
MFQGNEQIGQGDVGLTFLSLDFLHDTAWIAVRGVREGGMASDNGDIERRLWGIADQLRANSGLKPSEYSRPVLGLLFLRYADGRFADIEKQLQPRPGSRLGAPTPDAFKARGVTYLTADARFSHLLALPEGACCELDPGQLAAFLGQRANSTGGGRLCKDAL